MGGHAGSDGGRYGVQPAIRQGHIKRAALAPPGGGAIGQEPP